MILYTNLFTNKSDIAKKIANTAYFSKDITSTQHLQTFLQRNIDDKRGNVYILSNVIQGLPKYSRTEPLKRTINNFEKAKNVHVIDVEITSPLEEFVNSVFPSKESIVQWASERFETFIISESWSQIEKGTRNNSMRFHIWVVFDKPITDLEFKRYLRLKAKKEDFCIGLSKDGHELKRLRTHDEAVFQANRLIFEHYTSKFEIYGNGKSNDGNVLQGLVNSQKYINYENSIEWVRVFKKKDKKKRLKTAAKHKSKVENISKKEAMHRILNKGKGVLHPETVIVDASNNELTTIERVIEEGVESLKNRRFHSLDGDVSNSAVIIYNERRDTYTLRDYAHGGTDYHIGIVSDGELIDAYGHDGHDVHDSHITTFKDKFEALQYLGGETLERFIEPELDEVSNYDITGKNFKRFSKDKLTMYVVHTYSEANELAGKLGKKKTWIPKKRWFKSIGKNAHEFVVSDMELMCKRYDNVILVKAKFQNLVSNKSKRLKSKYIDRIIAVGISNIEMQVSGGVFEYDFIRTSVLLWSKTDLHKDEGFLKFLEYSDILLHDHALTKKQYKEAKKYIEKYTKDLATNKNAMYTVSNAIFDVESKKGLKKRLKKRKRFIERAYEIAPSKIHPLAMERVSEISPFELFNEHRYARTKVSLMDFCYSILSYVDAQEREEGLLIGAINVKVYRNIMNYSNGNMTKRITCYTDYTIVRDYKVIRDVDVDSIDDEKRRYIYSNKTQKVGMIHRKKNQNTLVKQYNMPEGTIELITESHELLYCRDTYPIQRLEASLYKGVKFLIAKKMEYNRTIEQELMRIGYENISWKNDEIVNLFSCNKSAFDSFMKTAKRKGVKPLSKMDRLRLIPESERTMKNPIIREMFNGNGAAFRVYKNRLKQK